MKTTTKRALQLVDLKEAGIPVRHERHRRDGGSWEAEIYIGDQWLAAKHVAGSKVTDVGGLAGMVTTTIEVI